MSARLPRGVRHLLALALPGDQREPITGDLEEEYDARVRRTGTPRAAVWAWWTAARLAASFTGDRVLRRRGLPPIAEEIPGRIRMWEWLIQDVMFGARMLRRQPGFTAVAVLTLALGVGANTAIFSIVDAVLWRPLPFPHAEDIVSITEQRPREGRMLGLVSPADFLDWRRDSRSFAAMAAYDEVPANLTGGGEPERVRTLAVSPAFLSALGVVPARGRDFRTEEDTPGRDRVVLLSDGVWRRRFGADPGIVGKTIALDGVPQEVIGILPSSFWWAMQSDMLTPYAFTPEDATVRSLHQFRVVARRRSGVSLEQAKAEMDAIGRRLTEQYPESNTGHAPNVVPLRDTLVGDVRRALLVLLSAVGLVLLIACANVATLLLARATSRQKELAVRIAIGAGRARLVRQLLTESVLLALIGGSAGVLLAGWCVQALRAVLPAQFAALPGIQGLGVDLRVLAVTLVVSLATGILFGLIPAVTASHERVGLTLNEEGRGGGSSARGRRTRAALVVAEMALSLILLVGAALLLVSFKHLIDVSPGFESDNLIATPISLPAARYADHARIVGFYRPLLERLRSMPGIESADVVTALPFTAADARLAFQIEGRTGESPVPVRAHPRLVSPGYLATMRIPLVRGRYFTDRDNERAPDVVIINSAAARRFWPDEDPIGRRINFAFGDPRWMEIVGVVRDIKHQGLDVDSNPEAYMPFLQTLFASQARNMTLALRTKGDAAAVAPLVRTAVGEIDKEQPIGLIGPVGDLIARSVAPRRLNLLLIAAFAVVALALTAIGLYGVMASLVAQRTHEIGVRMALGASRRSVLALMLRQAGAMTLTGIALGVAGALAVSRWVTTLLFDVRSTDPAVYLAVSALLAAVAFLAVAIPSSRATRVDPLKALRQA